MGFLKSSVICFNFKAGVDTVAWEQDQSSVDGQQQGEELLSFRALSKVFECSTTLKLGGQVTSSRQPRIGYSTSIAPMSEVFMAGRDGLWQCTNLIRQTADQLSPWMAPKQDPKPKFQEGVWGETAASMRRGGFVIVEEPPEHRQ